MSPGASVAAALMSIALSDSRAPLPTVVGPRPSHAARINDKVTILDLRCTIPVPIHDARERGNATFAANDPRSEERHVGKECVSTRRSRRPPCHYKKKRDITGKSVTERVYPGSSHKLR